MPYSTKDTIQLPQETKYRVRDVKDKLGMTYREFLETAADEFDPDT